MRPVVKTVTLTVAFAAYVDDDGNRHDVVESIYQKVDERRAARILRDRLGVDNLMVSHIEQSTDKYAMPLEEFLEHAVLIEG